jgi:glycosyltransferase involved in cell wall biosynthesis
MSYIAAGKPIVLAMDGEANRTVNEYGCGFATESGNAALLADSIEKLARMSAKEREAIAARVRALHLEKFERDSNLERFINFIFE